MDDFGEVVFRNEPCAKEPPGNECEHSASEDKNESGKGSPLACQAGDKYHPENNAETLLENLGSSISHKVQKLHKTCRRYNKQI